MKNKKPNIIDVLCVIILIFIVAFGVFKISKKVQQSNQDSVANIKYVVEIENQDTEILNYIKEGDLVFESTSSASMGTVLNITEKPYKIYTENKNDKIFVMSEIPDKITLSVEISAVGNIKDNGIAIDDIGLLVGKTLDMNIGNSFVKSVIVDVEAVENSKGAQE